MADKLSAKALIVNSDGKFLVLTNSNLGFDSYLAYRADLPGGTAEPGETEEEALLREVREEIGIDITAAPRVRLGQYGNASGTYAAVVYLVWANVKDISLDTEHCMFSWLTLAQIERLEWWGRHGALPQAVAAQLERDIPVEFPEYKTAFIYA